MDLQDFWQENKRWVLGVVAGLIVYWIGSSIVGAAFGGEAAVKGVKALAVGLNREEFYDREALEAARAENERLKELAARVRAHVGFVPDDEFVLVGKGDPELYFPDVERRVRQHVLVRAQELSVALDERGLVWPPPVGREEIQERLIGLCALQHAADRLLDAGQETLRRAPDAVGLQSIDQLAIDKRVSSRRPPRQGSSPDAAVAGLLDEYRVKFAFRTDVATLQAWLEKLRSEKPSIGLSPDLRVTPGDQVGDPVLVQGTLSALVLREER